MKYTIFMGLHTCIDFCLLVCATTTTKAKQIAFNPPNCGQEIKDTSKETHSNYRWTKDTKVNKKVISSPSSPSPCLDSWLRGFSLWLTVNVFSLFSSLDGCEVLSFSPGTSTLLDALAGCTRVLLYREQKYIFDTVWHVSFLYHSHSGSFYSILF